MNNEEIIQESKEEQLRYSISLEENIKNMFDSQNHLFCDILTSIYLNDFYKYEYKLKTDKLKLTNQITKLKYFTLDDMELLKIIFKIENYEFVVEKNDEYTHLSECVALPINDYNFNEYDVLFIKKITMRVLQFVKTIVQIYSK